MRSRETDNRRYTKEEKQEIAAFCTKMLEFLDEVDDYGFLDGSHADAFFSFGFIMDCGESWISNYGERAFNSFEAIDELYDSGGCHDIFLLGSAIFSQWRYWNHWSYGPMDVNGHMWFVVAFNMLQDLCSEE